MQDIATTQDGGVSNLAVGSFTGAGADVEVTLGFRPRYVRFINLTDRIEYEWVDGMAAGHTLKTVAAGTRTDDSGGIIVPKGGADSYRGFLVLAAAAIDTKLCHYYAFG